MLPLVVLGGAWPGMVTVETIGRIRRAFLVDHKPIRQIVRELRISRKTVRKAIRGSSTEFRYERGVQPQPRLGEFVGRGASGPTAVPTQRKSPAGAGPGGHTATGRHDIGRNTRPTAAGGACYATDQSAI